MLNKLNGSTHKQMHAAAAKVLNENDSLRNIHPICTIVITVTARMTDGDRPVMNAYAHITAIMQEESNARRIRCSYNGRHKP